MNFMIGVPFDNARSMKVCTKHWKNKCLKLYDEPLTKYKARCMSSHSLHT